MVLRQNAVEADLIRADERQQVRADGRRSSIRITARRRASGKILRFKMRDEKDTRRAPLRRGGQALSRRARRQHGRSSTDPLYVEQLKV